MVLEGVYDWSQTAEEVAVIVPLKGSAVSAVDVYASRMYIKVNYRPYLINLDLHAAVDERSGLSTVSDGTLTLRFQKLAPGAWPELLCANHKDKAAMRKRRIESMEDKQRRDEEDSVKRMERRMDDEKLSTRMQMQVDEMERQRLDDLKAEEKRLAEQSVYQALQGLGQQAQQQEPEKPAQDASQATISGSKGSAASHATVSGSKENAATRANGRTTKSILKKGDSSSTSPRKSRGRRVSFSDECPEAVQDPFEGEGRGAAATAAVADDGNAIFGEEDLVEAKSAQSEAYQTIRAPESPPQARAPTPPKSVSGEVAGDGDDLDRVVPAPRAAARVTVAFTARVFPTPMRESKKEEEEDWLLRNRRHLKGKVRERLDAVDISEKDPFWLKGKGDDFFRAGNFEGALNAYACALEVDGAMVSCMSNRAACLLKLGHFERCVEDCAAALEQLRLEREEESALALAEGFAEPPKELRRVRAMRIKLHVRKGTALRHLEKYPEALREFQLAFELDPHNEELKADCERLTCLVQSAAQKDLGDLAFRSSEFERALQCYSKALEFNPESVPALSNRSACHLKLGDAVATAADCEQALALLGPGDKEGPARLKLLQRLGGARAKHGLLSGALEAFRSALDLAPSDLELAKRIKRVEAAIAAEQACA